MVDMVLLPLAPLRCLSSQLMNVGAGSPMNSLSGIYYARRNRYCLNHKNYCCRNDERNGGVNGGGAVGCVIVIVTSEALDLRVI